MIKLTFYLLGLLFLTGSCKTNVEETKQTLGERVLRDFEQPLSSLSIDEDGTMWIGTERGDLYLFDRETKNTTCFGLGKSRIYKTLRMVLPGGDSILVVARRNSALEVFKWPEMSLQKEFLIEGKDNQYSQYDFLSVNNILYVATSNGFYQTDLSDTTSVYLKKITSEPVKTLHFNKTDSSVYYPDSVGVRVYSIKNQTVETVFTGYVDYLAFNDSVWVAINSIHNKGYISDKQKKEFSLKDHPRVYFEDGYGNHWFLSDSHISVGQELTGSFEPFVLNVDLPMKCTNIIADGKDGFTYLITHTALWKIPQHLSIFESHTKIDATCKIGSTVYIVTSGKELYRMDEIEMKPKEVCRLKDVDGRIKWICGNNKLLYIITENKVYQLDLLLSWNHSVSQISGLIDENIEITAVHYIESSGDLLIGTRYGLKVYDSKNVVLLDSEMYITSIKSIEKKISQLVYLTTFNDGQYLYESNYLQPFSLFDKIPFTKDMIYISDGSGYLLTQQHLIPSKDTCKKVEIMDLTHLIPCTETDFLAFPFYGIEKYHCGDKGDIQVSRYYQDLRFNPGSAVPLSGDYLFVGSNLGGMVVDTHNMSDYQRINFVKRKFRYELLLIFIPLFIILTGILVWLIMHYKKQGKNLYKRLKRKEKQLSIRKVDLEDNFKKLTDKKDQIISLLDDLSDLIPGLEDEKQLLIKRFEEGSSTSVAFLKDMFVELSTCEDNCRKSLKKRIDVWKKQAEMSGHFEIKELIKIVESEFSNDRPAEAGNVCKEIEAWFKQYPETVSEISRLYDLWLSYPLIPNLTSSLHKLVIELFCQVNTCGLAELQEKYKHIHQQIEELNTEENHQLLNLYIKKRTEFYKTFDCLPYKFVTKKLELVLNKEESILLRIKSLSLITSILPLGEYLRGINKRVSVIYELEKNGTNKADIEEQVREQAREIERLTSKFCSGLPESEKMHLHSLCLIHADKLTLRTRLLVILFSGHSHLLLPERLLSNSGSLASAKSRLLKDIRVFVNTTQSENSFFKMYLSYLIKD